MVVFPCYLLYVSDVHQSDDFILLGGAGPGAGALKAQVTSGDRVKTPYWDMQETKYEENYS